MRRRTFLAASAASAAAVAAGWPRFLRRAFADASVDGARRPGGQLGNGWDRAVRLGKPLLAIVVPEDDGAKWTRGGWFGEYLNHGSDAQMAPPALPAVACPPIKELP